MRRSKKLILAVVAAAGMAAGTLSDAAFAESNYLGEIQVVGFKYCPKYWLEANGQLLEINGNEALFSLLGTLYGGDGRKTFGLPDLQGRMPIGVGDGPDLSPVTQGQKGGTQSFTLTSDQLPSHSHAIVAGTATAKEADPTGAALGKSTIYATGTPSVDLNPDSIASAGKAQSIAKQSPYLGLVICIATRGLYPSRPQPQ